MAAFCLYSAVNHFSAYLLHIQEMLWVLTVIALFLRPCWRPPWHILVAMEKCAFPEQLVGGCWRSVAFLGDVRLNKKVLHQKCLLDCFGHQQMATVWMEGADLSANTKWWWNSKKWDTNFKVLSFLLKQHVSKTQLLLPQLCVCANERPAADCHDRLLTANMVMWTGSGGYQHTFLGRLGRGPLPG